MCGTTWCRLHVVRIRFGHNLRKQWLLFQLLWDSCLSCSHGHLGWHSAPVSWMQASSVLWLSLLHMGYWGPVAWASGSSWEMQGLSPSPDLLTQSLHVNERIPIYPWVWEVLSWVLGAQARVLLGTTWGISVFSGTPSQETLSQWFR